MICSNSAERLAFDICGRQTTAVIVTHNPSYGGFLELLNELTRQVAFVIVVDNNSDPHTQDQILSCNNNNKVFVTALDVNIGVAAAQNVGIKLAAKNGSKYVAVFDHDSLPHPKMLLCLVKVAEAKAAQGFKVGSLGPRYVDRRLNNAPPFIRICGLQLERYTCSSPEDVVEVDYLISSGSLIPMSTLQQVGLMREDLFIDYIDIEWGLRAKAKGFQSFGVCDAEMYHSLGEEPISLLGKKFPNHSPLRHYYHFRNAIHLYKESWVPLNWKLVDGWKLLQKFGFYSLFGKPRRDHFMMMSRGLLHGLLGKSGCFKSDG